MNNHLKVLIIEDSEDDVHLLIRQLKKNGYNPLYKQVQTADDMREQLNENKWDIIITDYSLPFFNGLEALKVLKEKNIDIPFIILSGMIGEETAVEAMKAGAHDYIKKDNMARLIPAIGRELREANIRKQKLKAINSIKKLNYKLAKKNKELINNYKELEDLNAKLVKAKDEADSANRAKSEFLATVSHELRTPLNGILGNTQLLLLDNKLDFDIKESIETIQERSQHLLTIIQDILKIVEIDTGLDTYIKDVFIINDIVKNVLHILQKDIELKQLKLNISIPQITIHSDKAKIRKIILNLLSNAVKFTEYGMITIKVDIIANNLIFMIADTGIGISDDKIKHIFEPFFQVDSKTNRVYEGLGLGLHVSKRLIETLGGKLWVESINGVGSKFYFQINVA